MNIEDLKEATGTLLNLRKAADLKIAQNKLFIYESIDAKTEISFRSKSRKQMANFLDSVLHTNFDAKTVKAKCNFRNEFYKGLEKVSKDAWKKTWLDHVKFCFRRVRFFDPYDLQFLDIWKAIYDMIEKLFKKGILKKFTFALCTSASKENIKDTEDLDEVDKTCDSQSDQTETFLNQNSFIPEWETFTETFSELLSASADSLSQTEDSTVDLVTIAKFEELARATKDFDSKLLIGSGSFGDVFLADLEVGGRLTKIAVKRFKPVFYFRLRRLISI